MKIVIIGTGAQAKYIVEIFKLINIKIIGILKTSYNKKNFSNKIDDIEIIGGLGLLDKFKRDKTVRVIIANSSNKEKMNLVKKIMRLNFKFTNAIHPLAIIATTAKIGNNVIINPGAIIQPFAKIGDGVMVHAGAIVEHNCIIEDYVNLAPGAKLAGWVKVKKGSYVYINATVIPQVVVGKNSIVGAGAVVISNVPDNSLVVGIPASLKKKLNGELYDGV